MLTTYLAQLHSDSTGVKVLLIKHISRSLSGLCQQHNNLLLSSNYYYYYDDDDDDNDNDYDYYRRRG